MLATSFAWPAEPGERERSKAELGKELHLRILGRYKHLNPATAEPYLAGAIKNPTAMIIVPLFDWEGLIEPQRDLLRAYAESCVPMVKADPFRFAGLSPNAPLSGRIRREVSAMTNKSWGIMAGAVYKEGTEVRFDKVVAQGTP